MFRVVLLQLLLFSLPFIGFGVYYWATRGLLPSMSDLQARQLVIIVASGALLVVLGFVLLATFDRTSVGHYVPLQYHNGQLIPGGFKSD